MTILTVLSPPYPDRVLLSNRLFFITKFEPPFEVIAAPPYSLGYKIILLTN
jgi:hypothetical protein